MRLRRAQTVEIADRRRHRLGQRHGLLLGHRVAQRVEHPATRMLLGVRTHEHIQAVDIVAGQEAGRHVAPHEPSHTGEEDAPHYILNPPSTASTCPVM